MAPLDCHVAFAPRNDRVWDARAIRWYIRWFRWIAASLSLLAMTKGE
jgi:hypothetical protein